MYLERVKRKGGRRKRNKKGDLHLIQREGKQNIAERRYRGIERKIQKVSVRESKKKNVRKGRDIKRGKITTYLERG